MIYDSLIVGGGIAGLSAALTLGQARRQTLLCSEGLPRNAPAVLSQNFVTRDGVPPLELLAIAESQLQRYENVKIQRTTVAKIQRLNPSENSAQDGGFLAVLASGSEIRSRTVILATGMRDELHSLDGLSSLWGDSVFACPFCHGWEYRDRRWAVMVDQTSELKMVKMARSWAHNLLVCSADGFEPDKEQSSKLKTLGIDFVRPPVIGLVGEKKLTAVRLKDGREEPCEAMLFRPSQQQRSPLAASLGCKIGATGYVETAPPFGTTSVPGVFAVGDMTNPMQSLIAASASGSFAASGVQHTLAEEDFTRDLRPRVKGQ